MKKYTLNVVAILLISLSAFASNPAYGDSHSYDFHADAKMAHKNFGPIDKAYGYMNVITDNSGKSTINVMFSNGSEIDWARFNARVKFLDSSGLVIEEEHIYRWIDAAGVDGAEERRVSKSLTVTEFETIEVDFYLSDLSDINLAMLVGIEG